MNVIAFDLEIEKFNGYVFVEKLHIKIGGVCFGEFGGNSERGLVLGGIQDLLQGIEAQTRFPRLDALFQGKDSRGIHAMLDGACWGTGEWAFGPPDAPSSPYVFLALPAATELFDGERAYLIVSSAGGSQLIYKHCMSGDVGGVVVDIGEYVGTWRAIVERLRSP